MPYADPKKRRAYAKEYSRKYYAEHKERLKERSNNRKADLRQWFRDLKTTLSCEECGQNHPATLDFHHRGEEEKSFTISENIHNFGKERLEKEIAKCTVLCANCHRIHHYDERNQS